MSHPRGHLDGWDAGGEEQPLDGRLERIAGITGFPRDLELFTQLGLPARSA